MRESKNVIRLRNSLLIWTKVFFFPRIEQTHVWEYIYHNKATVSLTDEQRSSRRSDGASDSAACSKEAKKRTG